MTRDYRRGAPPPRRRQSQRHGTCAFWFLVGGLLGGFGVGAAWMLSEEPAALKTAAQSGGNTDNAPSTETTQQHPTFDFWKSLQEEVVMVPDEREPEPVPLPPQGQSALTPSQTAKATAPSAAAKPAEPAPAAATPKPTTGGEYLLQVGSFRKSEDAERLKAQLAMLGIQTTIQTATIPSGQTYHRVRTGSYAKADANALKSRLKSNGHDAMIMRAR
jgi:cell division protein FtsN